jgi:PKD repeat protein
MNYDFPAANFVPGTLTVNNVAPVVGVITAPVVPVAVGVTVNATAPFTDPSSPAIHTVLWTWDDGISSGGSTSETAGSGTASGSHIYTQAGIYTISVTVTDDGGLSGTATALQYLVIYDPNGGFVTGGGWINSPAGAYPANSTLSGRANFGFVSKYQKGTNMPPVGETEFQFQVASFNFHSTSYDWLVVSSTKMAQYKGTGTVNGSGNYGFLLTAIDDSTDKFRIKIWDKATGTVVYDNQIGASEDSSAATAIGGGSIVIHK